MNCLKLSINKTKQMGSINNRKLENKQNTKYIQCGLQIKENVHLRKFFFYCHGTSKMTWKEDLRKTNMMFTYWSKKQTTTK